MMARWVHVRVSQNTVDHTQYIDQIEIERDSDGAIVAVWIENPTAVLEYSER